MDNFFSAIGSSGRVLCEEVNSVAFQPKVTGSTPAPSGLFLYESTFINFGTVTALLFIEVS